MPIPRACVDPPTLCCNGWWDVANSLACCAAAAVKTCLGSGCEGIDAYVSHEAPIGGGDYVACWLASAAPSTAQIGKLHVQPFMRYSFVVAICLSGGPWEPKVQRSELAVVPSADEHNWSSRHTYAAAQAALRALTNQIISTPGSLVGPCNAGSISSLIAEPPAAGSARWRIGITVEGPVSW